PEMIRKYVAYAKKNCFPIFTQEAYDTIQNDYLNIRNMGEDGSIPITARQLEAYVRLSEASAKMHLRDYVTEEDAQTAVRLIDYYLDRIARTGDGYDIDLAGGEMTRKERKNSDVIREIIQRYTSTGGVTIDIIVDDSGLAKSVVDSCIENFRSFSDVIQQPNGKYKWVGN
ncbi:MAG: minichromosome maintenance protein MCM, partial [Candidatus Methanomethylophilaceae archaeon]|nr:minichromosome maintenance protein MCM [Candidatus Methanomethylophilaceae archaeon]